MSFQPHFSVVICNYNYAAFVGDAIRSALAQDYPADRVQVVVVDDGSTDQPDAVYAAFAGHPQVLVVRQPNRGQTAAFAAGVQACSGDYVCLLDSDDLFLPAKLARVADHIRTLGEAPDDLFLCHDLQVLDSSQDPPQVHGATWFTMVGIDQCPDCLTLDQPIRHFPFSIPCGLVFSRALVAACLDALPTWDFQRGADGILCPSAFLKTGRVHYLRERLGVYRIHGGNDFARLVDGRYEPRFNPHARAPKSLRHLEHWVDMLDLPPEHRARALDYLRRLEHHGRRLSASRGLREPPVSVIGLPGADGTAFTNAQASESLQSAAQVEFLVPADQAAHELVQLAEGYRRAQGEYLVFLPAGDRLDRTFVERHLFLRQHGPLVAVSCSDVRLTSSAGSLISADVYRNSGAWKQAMQQIPPLATRLQDWVAPPRSACLFRCTAFLDRLLANPQALDPSLQQAGFWLVFQLALHTGGAVRFLETLGSVRLPDGAAASYGYLSAPSDPSAGLAPVPVGRAARWLAHWIATEGDLFRQWLPAAWHARFAPWIAAQQEDPAG